MSGIVSLDWFNFLNAKGYLVKNFSVRLKLLIGIAPLIALVAILALTAISSLNSLTLRADRLMSVNYILNTLNEIRSAQLAYTLKQEHSELANLHQAYTRLSGLIDESQKIMPSPQAQASLGATRDIMQGYMDGLKRSLDTGSTELNGPFGTYLMAELLKAVNQVQSLIGLQNKIRAEEFDYRVSLMLAEFYITLLLACGFAWLVVRQICRPLQRALKLARDIIDKGPHDNTAPLRNDEFGELAQALMRISSRLPAGRSAIPPSAAIENQLNP